MALAQSGQKLTWPNCLKWKDLVFPLNCILLIFKSWIKQSNLTVLFRLLIYISLIVHLLTVNKLFFFFLLCIDCLFWLYNNTVPFNHILLCRIPFLIRRTVSCYGVALGSDKEWNFAWEMYNHTDSTKEDKDILLSAMSCAKESWLLHRWPWSKHIFVGRNHTKTNTAPYEPGRGLPAAEPCV